MRNPEEGRTGADAFPTTRSRGSATGGKQACGAKHGGDGGRRHGGFLEVEFAGGVATLRKHTPNTSGSSGIRGVVSFIAGAESHLPRRPSAVLPLPRPMPLVFCHASAFHSWPRHPPLGGGSVLPPFLLLAFVEFHGGFLKIPRSTGNVELSMRLAGTRRRRDSPPYHMRKDERWAVLAQASDKSEAIPFLACRCAQSPCSVLHPGAGNRQWA